jgi:vanillate/3-O-methylgallate O-demethylase
MSKIVSRLDPKKFREKFETNHCWEKGLLAYRQLPLLSASEAQEDGGDIRVYARFITTMVPWMFTHWFDECMSWVKTCFIGDWSAQCKFHVKGPDALKFFSNTGVNNFTKFDIGQAKHCIMCNDLGKVTGEGVLMRYGEDEFQTFGGIGLWAEYMLNTGNYNAVGTQKGPDIFSFHVQGPNSIYVLEKVIGEGIRDIKFMYFRKSKINGVEVTLLRTGMSGELGYEVHGSCEYAAQIYQAIYEAGEKFGILKLGERAGKVQHVQACFPTVMADYVPAVKGIVDPTKLQNFNIANVEQRGAFLDRVPGGSLEYNDIKELWRSPLELGWGRMIDWNHDFIGKAALEKEMKDPNRKTMITLVWNSEDCIDVYASLFHKTGEVPYEPMDLPKENYRRSMAPNRVENAEGKLIGNTSNRSYSVLFREMISLGTIEMQYATPGTDVFIIWGEPGKPQKKIRAKVAQVPYKKDNRRVDVTKLPVCPL